MIKKIVRKATVYIESRNEKTYLKYLNEIFDEDIYVSKKVFPLLSKFYGINDITGISDYFIIKDGIPIFIEFKLGNDNLRDTQIKWNEKYHNEFDIILFFCEKLTFEEQFKLKKY